MSNQYKIVIDTNVFIAAMRSNRGAAYRLMSMVGQGKFDIGISVPLIFEYEEVAKRGEAVKLIDKQIDEIIDYICLVGVETDIFYLWRPYLSDPKDDFVLELAIHAQADFIVTYNMKDFKAVDKLGISVISPQTFLQQIG